MITLADAIRREFERTHPNGKNTLKCTSCYHRKDRLDFRETPWHGRAAACMRCEGSRTLWRQEQIWWELGQTREKVRAYQRYVRHIGESS